jgi:hypothetical protein
MGKLRCEGTYIDSKCKEKKCRQFAVTRRKWWRFGGQDKSAVVDYYIHLCARCADLFDESRREAAWEARVS